MVKSSVNHSNGRYCGEHVETRPINRTYVANSEDTCLLVYQLITDWQGIIRGLVPLKRTTFCYYISVTISNCWLVNGSEWGFWNGVFVSLIILGGEN